MKATAPSKKKAPSGSKRTSDLFKPMSGPARNLPENESSIRPFRLEWSIGINPNVPLLNLTTANRTVIAYACSHAVILYDYQTKESVPLQGHQHQVATQSASRDGKWLLTADYGNDSVVIVWDTETGVPVSTLFNPHGKRGMTAARISPNAKYVVTVGNELAQRVFFWLWTRANDKPDASCKLIGIHLERIKEISFNEDRCEEFALTSDYRLIFFSWKRKKLSRYAPQVIGKEGQYGVFNCSCFLLGNKRALTGTANGFLLVWQRIGEDEESEQYEHLKYIELQRSGITTILNHKRLVVTGNTKGRVTFYDQDLKILYWCEHPGLDSIRSISFDRRSTLLGAAPARAVRVEDQSDLEFDDYSDYGEEAGADAWGQVACGVDFPCKIHCTKSSTIASDQPQVCSALAVNLEASDRATDATIRNAAFTVRNFFVSTATGVIALIQVSKLKCHFFLQDSAAPITSLAVHPHRNYLLTGDARGMMRFYNYQDRSLIGSKKLPPLPDFYPILAEQLSNKEIVYVSCAEAHESQTSVTELKYSPQGDILVCGLENGAIWMLHPLALECLEKLPYKHSSESILKVVFSECTEYMAYSDNSLAIAVFKRNRTGTLNLWNLMGKYHGHYMAVTDLLFGLPTSDSDTPRLFSLGEDRDLVEYDLKHSGPYPEPGLQVQEITRIESTAIPLSLSWYPRIGLETFLMISNSEYKYRLLNDVVKTIRGTFLGPTFGAPVHQVEIRSDSSQTYGIFVTEKELGLQLLPLDGNPYKTIGMIGHPRKITKVVVDCEGDVLFASGYKDPCVLMWKIKYRAVDRMARLGGDGLYPFYCLIDGGSNGWFIREMQDLFYYAQILQQGENTTAVRTVSDKLAMKQIPNLLRAVGFYPSNEELELILGEASYRTYAETGQILDEISFEDFVKLYINHRPVVGLSLSELRNAFETLANPNPAEGDMPEATSYLSRRQFLDALMGKDIQKSRNKITNSCGEPLTRQEALLFLSLLGSDQEDFEVKEEMEVSMDHFNFLPERISYKEFITDIMGIELPEESRAGGE